MQYSSTITMSHKEMNYMRMCIRIFEGTLSMRQGAEELGVSYRTIQRKMSRFRTHGQEGIVHKLRNAPPNRHIDYEVKTQVLSLLSTTYKGYSASYASELLADEHHIIISPSSIRRWLTPHTTYQIIRQSHSLIKPRQKILGLRYLDNAFMVYSHGQEIFVKEI